LPLAQRGRNLANLRCTLDGRENQNLFPRSIFSASQPRRTGLSIALPLAPGDRRATALGNHDLVAKVRTQ